MSTVVLTPTHIAGDHCFVELTLDKRVYVDITQKKVFLDPTLRFALGLNGAIDQAQVDHPDTYAAVHHLLQSLKDPNKKIGKAGSPFFFTKEHYHFERLANILESEAAQILVTATNRYALYVSKSNTLVGVTHLPQHFGIGTGGGYAAGLLIGGMDLPDIWSIVNRFDPLTSCEYTMIPLSVLMEGASSDE
jgi:hypothetical protein